MDRLIAPYTVPVGSGDVAPSTGTPGQATDGNPATNTPATRFPAYAFNALQEEVMAVLAAAGISPDKTNNGQLAQAIPILAKVMGDSRYALLSDLLGASSIPPIGAATTLTASAAGKHHVFSAGVAATLPAASSLSAGQSISFQSLFAGASVVRAGTDVITTGNGTPTSITLNAGDTLTLMSNGATGWYVVDGSTQLQYAAIMRSLTSLGTGTGYRQFPAYPGDPTPLLVQWGSTVSPAAANTEATTTLQTSFPIECSDVLLTDYATLSNVGVIWTVSAKNQGNFKAYWGAGSVSPGSTNARSAMYVAIGR